MLRQIKYFQAVVRNNSFSEAAEECHISQSAVSQQIKALENELGFKLLERQNRRFALTPAGEHFYKKSLVLLADYERMCAEAARIAGGSGAVLRLGYLRGYRGGELQPALEEFSSEFPEVSVQLRPGDHEQLFELLRSGDADLVLSDQRRAFSDEYVNLILASRGESVEISARNPVAQLPSVTARELKNLPCILVSAPGQQKNEQDYYHTVLGFEGEFLHAETPEEARLMVISGQGFMPAEGCRESDGSAQVRHIPLYRGGRRLTRNYCLFWKKANANPFIDKLAAMLQREFSH